jgi:hypothetical protein
MSHFSHEQSKGNQTKGNNPKDNTVSSGDKINVSKKVPSLSILCQVTPSHKKDWANKSNFEVKRQSQSEIVKESFMSARKSERSGNMISGRNSIDLAAERVPIKNSKLRACCAIL